MLTFQVEPFERAARELSPIFAKHWSELALFRDRMPLAPQWDEYIKRDREGRLLLVTARKDGQLVAYYIAQVAPGFHYSTTLIAHMDIVYVSAEIKNRGLSLPLMRHVQAELERRGVQLWYSGYKAHRPQGMPELHGLLGFEPADVYLAKWIGQ